MATLTHVDLGPRERWAAPRMPVSASRLFLAFVHGAAILVCLYWLVGGGLAGWIVSRDDFRLPDATAVPGSGCVMPRLGEPVCPVTGRDERN